MGRRKKERKGRNMDYGHGNDMGAEGAGTMFFHEGDEEWYDRRRGDSAGVRLLGPPA